MGLSLFCSLFCLEEEEDGDRERELEVETADSALQERLRYPINQNL